MASISTEKKKDNPKNVDQGQCTLIKKFNKCEHARISQKAILLSVNSAAPGLMLSSHPKRI